MPPVSGAVGSPPAIARQRAQGTCDEERRRRTRFGLGTGLLAATPLMAVLCALWAQHWTPTGDDAVIAWRSLDVLGRHSPLVGQFSQASTGRAIFDPGPLEYWALAIPVRVLPAGIGAAAGATGVEVVTTVVALVAVARTAGRLAASMVTAGALLGTWSAAVAITDPVWNPNAALVPFAATLLLGWAVAMGSLWWWPAMVAVASYCVQAHLMYGPAVLLATALAPLVGVVLRSPRRLDAGDAGWAATGIGAALVLWSAPLYQQLAGHPGDLSSLWDATVASSQPTVGWWNALDQMARGIGPRPAWLGAPRPTPSSFALLGSTGQQVWTLAAIALVAVIGLLALRRKRPDVVALAAVTLSAVVGGLWALAGTPVAKSPTLSYLTWIVWPIGMFAWFTVGWGTARLVGTVALVRRRRATRTLSGRSAWRILAALACASVAVSISLALTVDQWPPRNIYSPTSNGLAAVGIASLVERAPIAPQRLHIEVTGVQAYELAPAIAVQLAKEGWSPTLSILLLHFTPDVAAWPTDAVLAVGGPTSGPAGGRRLGVVTVRDPDRVVHHWTVTYVRGTA